MSWIGDGFWHRYASNYHSVHKSPGKTGRTSLSDIGYRMRYRDTAISSLLLGAQHAVAVDIDPDAVKLHGEPCKMASCPV